MPKAVARPSPASRSGAPEGEASDDVAGDGWPERLEAQRRATAREIHDDIGGALAALHFDLAWLARQPHDAAVAERLRSAGEGLQQTIGAMRRIVQGLYPPDLSDGLPVAVRRLVADFGRRTGVDASFDASTDASDLAAPAQLAAYRTAQEALTNIARHAQCRHASVTLRGGDHGIALRIHDDGCGFAPATVSQADAFGLRGLAERARAVDGRLDIDSAPGQGTSLTLTIPRGGAAFRPMSA